MLKYIILQPWDQSIHQLEYIADGDLTHSINSEVSRMTVLMREISAAIYEQSSGIEQVNVVIAQTDQVAQHGGI